MKGCEINLSQLPNSLTCIEKLYSESNGRFIVEISQDKLPEFQKFFTNIPHYQLGKTNQTQNLTVFTKENLFLKVDLHTLKMKWKKALIF